LSAQGSLLELSVAARGPIGQVRIEPAAAGQLPAALAVADGRVFVADDVRHAVVAVDPLAGRILATYPVGGTPTALALAPDNRVAAVLAGAHGGVAIVDPYDGTVIDHVALPGLAATIAVKPQPAPSALP